MSFLFVTGLFQSGHMQYEVERDQSSNGEPSLTEMTEKAIKILKKNSKGFFLMVEGLLIYTFKPTINMFVHSGRFQKLNSA